MNSNTIFAVEARSRTLFFLSYSISRSGCLDVCLLTQPISKSHRRNAANQQLVCTDGFGHFLLLQHSQVARQSLQSSFCSMVKLYARRLLHLQRLPTPRDWIELLTSLLAERGVKRSAERSECLTVSAQASLRFSD